MGEWLCKEPPASSVYRCLCSTEFHSIGPFSLFIPEGEAAQHEHVSVFRIRVPAQDADQAAGRDSSVLRVV